MELFIGFIILVVLVVVGVPIVFSFGAATIWFTLSLGYDPAFLMPTAYSKLNGVVLFAIPLFIMAGGIMEKGKIGGALISFIEIFCGRTKGALCAVASVACAVFGSICGSGAATLSCIGSILAPKMRERNYPMGVAAAVLACAAPIGMLIPPSSIQILYAWSGQLSVLACFLSTVLPGILLTILIAIVGVVMARRESHKAGVEMILDEEVPRHQRWVMARKRTFSAAPALVMPIIILGGIYGGYMTPSEAAAISVIYALPVSIWVYKGVKIKGLKQVFVETATTTGVIMVMLSTIMVMSRILIMENLPGKVLELLLAISDNKYVILVMINIFLVIIGMIMDDVSGTLLCTPILIPIAISLGVSPYHMAAILGVNLGMGNITPPTAPFLYLGGRICKVNTKDMLKHCVIIILFAYLPTLILTTYVPQMALWLPNLIMEGTY